MFGGAAIIPALQLVEQQRTVGSERTMSDAVECDREVAVSERWYPVVASGGICSTYCDQPVGCQGQNGVAHATATIGSAMLRMASASSHLSLLSLE